MPVYVHVIDHPDARVLVDTPSSFEGVCSTGPDSNEGPASVRCSFVIRGDR